MRLSDEPDTVKQVLHMHGLIQKRVGKRVTRNSLEPLWYRGLSDGQMEAARSMMSALRDDILQGSTYRVYKKLNLLGVHPMPPKRGVRQLLIISRGNDVAFLWFLMEMFYKSGDQTEIYGMSEQIIMSAIFWLDLNPTLRKLDLLLPAPHASAATRLKRARAESRIKRRQEAALKTKTIAEQPPKSPYFQKPVLFKLRRSNLLAQIPMRPATVPKVPSESADSTLWSRWFADFGMRESECIGRSVFHREVNNILASMQAAKLNTSHVESMCSHHKQISELEQSLRMNLERIKLEQREKLIDVDYRTREQQRRRTLDDLERMTEYYGAKFHEMAVKTRIASTRKSLCVDLQDPNFLYLGSSESDENILLLEGGKPLPPKCVNSKHHENLKLNSELCESQTETIRQRPSSLMQFLQQGGTEKEQEQEQEQDQNQRLSFAPSQCPQRRNSSQYFELGNSACNYKFNYFKVFGAGMPKVLTDEQLRIKAEFVKALDEDVDYLNAVLAGDVSVSVNKLVDQQVKGIFKEGTEQFQEEYEKMRIKKAAQDPVHRLNFGMDYYDADNIDLMKEMLKIALKHVAKDRHYVLPTLPDVHTVPVLIEWICARYGKRYSRKECERSFKESKYLMDHLSKILDHSIIRSPSRRCVNITSKSSVIPSYSSMRTSMNNLRHKFSKSFAMGIMELGRIFYAAMQPHKMRSIASRYYAYMPGHFLDIDFNPSSALANRLKRSKADTNFI